MELEGSMALWAELGCCQELLQREKARNDGVWLGSGLLLGGWRARPAWSASCRAFQLIPFVCSSNCTPSHQCRASSCWKSGCSVPSDNWTMGALLLERVLKRQRKCGCRLKKSDEFSINWELGKGDGKTTKEVVTVSIGFGQGIHNQTDAYRLPSWLNAFPLPHRGLLWDWLGSQCAAKLCFRMMIIMEHGSKESAMPRVEWSSGFRMEEYLSLDQLLWPEERSR